MDKMISTSLSQRTNCLRRNKKYIALLIAVEAIFVLFRMRSSGIYHAQLRRFHDVFTVQILMCVMSSMIYGRIKELISSTNTVLRDMFKASALLSIFCSHASLLFFYIYVPDSSLISTICFICLSIYVHMGFFLVILVFIEYLSFHWKFLSKSLFFIHSKKFNTILSLVLALFLTGIGFAVARSAPVINRVNVKIRDLPSSLDGFSIVLLTDIHIGPTVDQKRVEEIVAKTNALHADMVAISGDLVDGFLSNLVQPTLPLANLKSKYGVYYATGNHEYYYGDTNEWLNYFATKFNVTVLHNANRNLCSSSGDCICVAGVDDLYTEELRIPDHRMDAERALGGCSETQPVILLVHQPNGASKILRSTNKRIDLILSGHTHAGQFYIVWLLAYLKNDFLYGHYKIKDSDTQIYVSSGVNYWGPPVKMLNLCEITLLTLHA